VLVPGLGADWVIAGLRGTVDRRAPAGTVACGSWLGSAGASAGRHADREITWLPSFARGHWPVGLAAQSPAADLRCGERAGQGRTQASCSTYAVHTV